MASPARKRATSTPAAAPQRPSSDGRGEGRRRHNLVFTLFGTYVLPTRRSVWSGGIVQALEDLGFTTAAARIALSRLVRKGFLTRVKEGRRVYLEMSPDLERVLAEGEQRIFSFGKQEPTFGTWTLLSYSIPEELRAERDRLRKRLTFLGFGSIHDAFWFTPRDRVDVVLKILDELQLRQYAEVFRGTPVNGDGVPELVLRAWDGEHLRKLYDEFTAEYAPYRSPGVRQRLSDRDAFLVRTRAVHQFRQFVELDPELPGRSAEQESRDLALETFHDVYSSLAEIAQSYFDRITLVGGPGSDR
jgi:phenylacetic acid degradation operon negative regulatory protein